VTLSKRLASLRGAWNCAASARPRGYAISSPDDAEVVGGRGGVDDVDWRGTFASLAFSGSGLNSATIRSTISSNVLSDFMPIDIAAGCREIDIDASTINVETICAERQLRIFFR
jgi:hypothetical protein